MGFPVLEKKAEIKMAEYSVASSRKLDVKKVYKRSPINKTVFNSTHAMVGNSATGQIGNGQSIYSTCFLIRWCLILGYDRTRWIR